MVTFFAFIIMLTKNITSYTKHAFISAEKFSHFTALISKFHVCRLLKIEYLCSRRLSTLTLVHGEFILL